MTGRHPRIWVLLGHRTGSNNQLLALAEALKWPFETRTVHFNFARIFHPWLGASLISLNRTSRKQMVAPWPDLVMGIGWRSVAVSRWIKRASGNRTKIVRLDDPRSSNSLFDLVVTTPHYPVRDGPNVMRLPVAMSRFRSPPAATQAERHLLDAHARPHRLLAVGGPAKYWRLTSERVISAAAKLAQRGGSLIIATSPRTPPDIAADLGRAGHGLLVAGGEPRFAVLLGDADEIFVTGDSVGMLSEAVLAGKPVGIVPIDSSERGERALIGDTARRRDLRRFWSTLRERGLAGTIDRPVAGHVNDPAVTAADAIKALMSGRA